MEGLSDEWTETDNPEIHFTGLPPGTYSFLAYASNAKGTRSKMPVTLSINILPAFWQTLFFKVAICLLAALLLYFFIRRRTARMALSKYEKARQERRLAELELEAIKAQINPHFIYNCLNSIQYFNYEKQHDQARQYLDLFARLIRFTMQYSRQAFITIAEETNYLSNYLQLEKMRFHERLHYQIIVADNIDQQLVIPAMLIQPYVENALKHGIAARKEGGTVIIRFDQPEEGLFMISVEDDGIGFTTRHNGNKSSLGLRLSGSRAETYNQLFDMKIEISLYNKKSFHPDKSGIIVQLKIPVISYEHTQL
jgi:LytS/YehU family sensor histidine kinase